ncbi:MAG: hypothetical protein NCW75_12670 [Phycisphaera sp.]|nr:MAG: hypothetical protein NCW75_12670 [Phycisphaera sp.]
MVTPIRAIVLLVSLAVLLAGPVSSFAATGDCCCTQAATQADAGATDACCEVPGDRPEHQDSRDDDTPSECPSECDTCVSCSVMSQPVQLSRPTMGLELPDSQPDAFTAIEPQSHAIEPHFSLLRPPRS